MDILSLNEELSDYNLFVDYYEANKEKVLAKQKECKDSIPKADKSRAKILYYLNTDPDYHLKIKESTKRKHDFKLENGKWV